MNDKKLDLLFLLFMACAAAVLVVQSLRRAVNKAFLTGVSEGYNTGYEVGRWTEKELQRQANEESQKHR